MSKSHLRNRSLIRSLLSISLLCLCLTTRSQAQCEWQWGPGAGLPGVDGAVHSTVVFDDGTGPALYAAGEFTNAGSVAANFVAKWNGTKWSALGSGMNDHVHALTVFDDGAGPALYAGGRFTTAGGVSAPRVAKWNGTNWSALGATLPGDSNSVVFALTVFDDGGGPDLYAGGLIGFNNIARWNGLSWSPVGSGVDNFVNALTVFDDGGGPALYAGGRFTVASGVNANRIAKWKGAGWSALGSGMDDDVRALTVFDDGGGPALYAGGNFAIAGAVAANRIAKWNGAAWSALGTGVNSSVVALTPFDDGAGPALYVGGFFTTAGGGSANHVARWNGVNWSSLGLGIDDLAIALTVFDDGSGPALYAGGGFTTAGDVGVGRIAKWDGAGWSAMGSGTNSGLSALVVFDDGAGPAVYAGGAFTTIGGVSAHHIAKRIGDSWLSLGSGMNNDVYALVVFDDGTGPALYAGGRFTDAGGISANHIAKWDGANWSPLGEGVDGPSWTAVTALVVFDDGGGPALYAAGDFTTAGGAGANYIAKWDGVNWSPLGSGVDAQVNVLSVFDDGTGLALFAGGGFHTAGEFTAHRIAKWDGSNWAPLGLGIVNSTVTAMTVFDDGGGPALYIGGSFNEAGGINANNIAKWDGAWSTLGQGVGHTVATLTVFDDGGGPAVYAGGMFIYALPGDVTINHAAKWDGSSWSALGSGMNYSVFALTQFDDGWGPAIYAGGYFTTAGGHASAYFAKWSCRLDTTRAISFTPSAQPSASASAIRVTLDSLHHVSPPYTGGASVPFTSFEGQVRWVGPPAGYVESTANSTPFIAAKLQCQPHYQDWSTVGLLHVFGSAIVPSSSYRVEMLDESCRGNEEGCTALSVPLTIVTTRWGDVEVPYNPPSTTTQPDIGDIAALVGKFRSVPGAPIKARALLAGSDAFGNIDISADLGFAHIAACVDAFRGKPYPYTIAGCP